MEIDNKSKFINLISEYKIFLIRNRTLNPLLHFSKFSRWFFQTTALRIVGLMLVLSGLTAQFGRASEIKVDPSAVILEVREELAARGVKLVVVHLPMRYELYDEPETPFDSPLKTLHPTTIQARQLDLRLRLLGVSTVDLYDVFKRNSAQANIYKENRFHVKESDLETIGADVARHLRSQKVFWREGAPKNVVFVGDCFANGFAEAARKLNSHDNVRSLIKFAGGGHAHNHLFAFEDEYLVDTDVVVWFLGDRNLCGHGFSPLSISHTDEDLESKTIQARIVKTTTITDDHVAKFNYPNATRATLFERLDTGEHFIGVDYIVKDRKIQTSRLFIENYRVQLSLLSLQAFEHANRDVAGEYLIDRLNDWDSPRFWIQGWLDLRPPEVVQITLQ